MIEGLRHSFGASSNESSPTRRLRAQDRLVDQARRSVWEAAVFDGEWENLPGARPVHKRHSI